MRKVSMNMERANDFNTVDEMFTLLKLISKYYDKLCKMFDITQVQIEVLYWLYTSKDNTVKMSTIGDKLEMARSGVTILVDRMALAGLVKRRPDREDRRIINLIITEKGCNIMNEIFPGNEVFRVSPLDFLEREEKEVLNKLIIKIKEKIEMKI
ncbi:hypothetical protein LF65_01650 [Clostridium beijerinckii]|uniref:HTH marR-type domain-containing protein n=1 Tax=Clostridium beijerinckii TaxID=1520 RepID=A0A0B5QBF1_CLOBE|nr:MarR family winged helix-turn-helix transcriptional regulator [Clostridium beijerinckii]AJG98255.1 hypothetical protein LF65_01650 [Clostridium beijerinckii]